MQPTSHIILSGAVSGILCAATGSPVLAATSFLAGFLIDADHIVDYVAEYGLHFDRRFFFESFHVGRYRKIRIVLHAWEWLAVILGIAWLTGWNDPVSGIAAGMTHHMIADQLTNEPAPLAYFLIWRVKTRFCYRLAFPNKPWHRMPGG